MKSVLYLRVLSNDDIAVIYHYFYQMFCTFVGDHTLESQNWTIYIAI